MRKRVQRADGSVIYRGTNVICDRESTVYIPLVISIILHAEWSFPFLPTYLILSLNIQIV